MDISKEEKIQKQTNKIQTHQTTSLHALAKNGLNEYAKQKIIQSSITDNQLQVVNHWLEEIMTNTVQRVVLILKQFITQNGSICDQKFRGIGFKQVWNGYFPLGAYQWFEHYIKTNNTNLNIYDVLNMSMIISLQRNQSQIQKIIQIYTALLQSFPKFQFQLFVGVGHAYYFNYQFLRAQKYYLQAEKLEGCEQLYECLAWVKGYWFQRQKQCIQYSKKCLQINSDNFRAIFLIAFCQSKDSKKILTYDQIVKICPNYYKTYIWLAQSRDQLEQQLFYYQKALQYDKNYAFTYIRMALSVYRKKKSMQQARKYIDLALKINTAYHLCYWALAEIEQQTDVQSAIRNYQKCLQLNPYYFQALQNLGNLYQKDNLIRDNDIALQYYQQYINLNPYNSNVYFRMGIIYFEKQEYQQAITYFSKVHDWSNQAASLSPILYNLGMCHYSLQQYQQALKYMKMCDKYDHNDKTVIQVIVECLFELRQELQIQQWLNHLLSIVDEDKVEIVIQFYSRLYTRIYDVQKSLRCFLQLISKYKLIQTDYLIKKLLKNKDESEVVSSLQKIYSQLTEEQNYFYKLIQIGLLYYEYHHFETAISIFNELKQAQEAKKIVEEPLKEEIFKLFRSKQAEGQKSVVQSCIFQVKKQKFNKLFTNNYKANQQK